MCVFAVHIEAAVVLAIYIEATSILGMLGESSWKMKEIVLLSHRSMCTLIGKVQRRLISRHVVSFSDLVVAVRAFVSVSLLLQKFVSYGLIFVSSLSWALIAVQAKS